MSPEEVMRARFDVIVTVLEGCITASKGCVA
jgi:hypothetical protein